MCAGWQAGCNLPIQMPGARRVPGPPPPPIASYIEASRRDRSIQMSKCQDVTVTEARDSVLEGCSPPGGLSVTIIITTTTISDQQSDSF